MIRCSRLPFSCSVHGHETRLAKFSGHVGMRMLTRRRPGDNNEFDNDMKVTRQASSLAEWLSEIKINRCLSGSSTVIEPSQKNVHVAGSLPGTTWQVATCNRNLDVWSVSLSPDPTLVYGWVQTWRGAQSPCEYLSGKIQGRGSVG